MLKYGWRHISVFLTGLVLSGAAYGQASPSAYTSGTRYDAAGRVTGTLSPDPDGAGPLGYAAVRNSYNSAGQLTKVEKGHLSAWQGTAVDPASWGAAFTLDQSVESLYDSVGQKIRDTVKAANGTILAVTQYDYDLDGKVTCTAVRMNPATFASPPSSACTLGTAGSQGPDRITRNVYDVVEQLIQVRKAVGTSLEKTDATYSYTPNGKRSTVVDGNGNRATLTYDGFDRLSRWTFPATSGPLLFDDSSTASALSSAGVVNAADYEAYVYDANGNRTSFRKRDGSTLTYSFDALNRMTVKVVPSRSGLTADQVRDVYYSYDLLGHQLAASFDSAAGTDVVTAGYDGFGELVSSGTAMGTFSKSLAYAYDADGNRTQVTHPDSQAFTYAFDGTDRLTNIYEGIGTSALLDQFNWNVKGMPDSRSGASGVTSAAYSWDDIGRLTALANSFAGSADNVSWAFTINPASQIATDARTETANRYAYGGLAAVIRNYGTNGLNQYTAAGPASFTYDANGNLTGDGTTTYVYDIENRLVSATAAGQTTSLSYDPMGRLFEVAGPSSDTRFLYDGDELVAEYDGSGTLLRRYVHGGGADDPMIWYEGATLASSGRRELFADRQGSIIAIADAAGAVIAVNAYDEYGIPATSTPNLRVTGRFAYTGQAWIPELGMYHYKARIYSPTLGRFLQTDPIGYDDQINLYAYVGDDPVNGADPTGLDGSNEHFEDVLKGRTAALVPPEKASSSARILSTVVGTAASVYPAVRIFNRIVQTIEGSPPSQSTAKTGNSASSSSGRAKNNLRPDQDATGPHSTFKRGADGNVSNYAEYKPNPQNPTGHQEVKRVDITGRAHTNPDGTTVPTPHVKEPGTSGVRPARMDELPRKDL